VLTSVFSKMLTSVFSNRKRRAIGRLIWLPVHFAALVVLLLFSLHHMIVFWIGGSVLAASFYGLGYLLSPWLSEKDAER
jgi:hypothetical protein